MNNSRPIISRLWIWHSACCVMTLLACVAIIWPQVFLPDAWEQRIISYSGSVALGSMLTSLLIMLISTFVLLLRLRNLRAIGQIFIWGLLWACAIGIFTIMAYMADVPMPGSDKTETEPIQSTDTLHQADSMLTGPDSLIIPIQPERFEAGSLPDAPHLLLLEEKHSELLQSYLSASPRWALPADDTFYTKPGHVVMTPPLNGGIPGLVHAAFRRIVEGEPLPAGFTTISPGDAIPGAPDGSEHVTDLAVELGRNLYLLLAWRGTSHTETAQRALCAALSTIDELMQPLTESPEPATVQKLLNGKRNITADRPELLLSQPPAQYGTYQAEIYVNPGEAGTLILRIADVDTDTTLRLFSCPALFSSNPKELFRHDIPGSVPEQMRATSFGHIPGLLPDKAPLFVICCGVPHQFFGVAFEVVFIPANATKESRVLLRRCYRVQAFEDTRSSDTREDEEESDL